MKGLLLAPLRGLMHARLRPRARRKRRGTPGLKTSAPPGPDNEFDVVFECAGQQEALDQGVELLKPGGTLVVVGIVEGDRISFDMNLVRRKELRIQNVRRQNECVREAIELAASGRIDLDSLVTHRFSLPEPQAAYDLVAVWRWRGEGCHQREGRIATSQQPQATRHNLRPDRRFS